MRYKTLVVTIPNIFLGVLPELGSCQDLITTAVGAVIPNKVLMNRYWMPGFWLIDGPILPPSCNDTFATWRECNKLHQVKVINFATSGRHRLVVVVHLSQEVSRMADGMPPAFVVIFAPKEDIGDAIAV